ncbi:hypothetical protein DFH09DRAFT_1073258 [Mycena vulgaris]|nr:hypothetical protein DFH09DRAFT_1073258 [Mycena vulgaris]
MSSPSSSSSQPGPPTGWGKYQSLRPYYHQPYPNLPPPHLLAPQGKRQSGGIPNKSPTRYMGIVDGGGLRSRTHPAESISVLLIRISLIEDNSSAAAQKSRPGAEAQAGEGRQPSERCCGGRETRMMASAGVGAWGQQLPRKGSILTWLISKLRSTLIINGALIIRIKRVVRQAVFGRRFNAQTDAAGFEWKRGVGSRCRFGADGEGTDGDSDFVASASPDIHVSVTEIREAESMAFHDGCDESSAKLLATSTKNRALNSMLPRWRLNASVQYALSAPRAAKALARGLFERTVKRRELKESGKVRIILWGRDYTPKEVLAGRTEQACCGRCGQNQRHMRPNHDTVQSREGRRMCRKRQEFGTAREEQGARRAREWS